MNEKHHVILYSSTGCGYCHQIKEDLKRWNLTWEERNVSEDPDYFSDLHDQGIFSVPVVILDGQTFIGYRPNAIKKALGLA